jgi:hypothetical protein
MALLGVSSAVRGLSPVLALSSILRFRKRTTFMVSSLFLVNLKRMMMTKDYISVLLPSIPCQ